MNTGAWAYGSLIIHNDNWHIVPKRAEKHSLAHIVDFMVMVIPDTIGQYINRKDRDGTRIYDGDILFYVPYETDANNITITHEDGVLWVVLNRSGHRKPIQDVNFSDYKIIGNTHKRRIE